MKNTKDFKAIVMEKKATLEILEGLMEKLASEEEWVLFAYDKIGEEQKTDNEGNLLYRDSEGTLTTDVTDEPAMRSVYGNVKKETLTETDNAKLEAIAKIREVLATLA